MNILVFLCLICTAWAIPNQHIPGYMKINGLWYKVCDEGSHAYSSDCGYVTPEPTCDNPFPKTDVTKPVCDYYGCYCSFPNVRHPRTKECVPLEECNRT